MITLTVPALDKVISLLEQEKDQDLALRVAIVGRGPGGFQYHLAFVKLSQKQPEDEVIDLGPFCILVDKHTAEYLPGSVMDYVTQGEQSGFIIENPNPLWKDPTAQRVQEVIDFEINPRVASHGGAITLVEVKGDTAYIAFNGGCQGCGMVDVTLKQGIEVMIKNAVPEIKNIVDLTDHAAGQNPYYESTQHQGTSPF